MRANEMLLRKTLNLTWLWKDWNRDRERERDNGNNELDREIPQLGQREKAECGAISTDMWDTECE